jgi:hypothetical protein
MIDSKLYVPLVAAGDFSAFCFAQEDLIRYVIPKIDRLFYASGVPIQKQAVEVHFLVITFSRTISQNGSASSAHL